MSFLTSPRTLFLLAVLVHPYPGAFGCHNSLFATDGRERPRADRPIVWAFGDCTDTDTELEMLCTCPCRLSRARRQRRDRRDCDEINTVPQHRFLPLKGNVRQYPQAQLVPYRARRGQKCWSGY